MKRKGIFKQSKGITLIALIVTIIILLILAGITIGTITGDNGIINKAQSAKEETEIANEKEVVEKATVQTMGNNKFGNVEKDGLQDELDKETGEGKTEVSDIGGEFEVFFKESERYYTVDKDGNVEMIVEEENTAEVPMYWEKTTKTDSEWYSYADISNGNQEVKVNTPKLRGAMTAIKYVGDDAAEQTGSKWANAITQDGSMWVWIPRYAYKITSGYHTNSETGGTIEIAFIDTNNKFLNGESGTIVTDPSQVTYTDDGTGNQVQNEWLVHPAFTSNAENGGGFGELTGLWVAKFEATGTYDDSTETGELNIKQGKTILTNMTINQQYKLAKNATYGESVKLNSHMAKNSEWGAITYLTQSKYGVNKQNLEGATNLYAGGNTRVSTIYGTNKKQSTTYNAYGVYGMDGGACERVASYVNYGDNIGDSNITNGGYGQEESLLGKNEAERATSTAYKTVYEASGTSHIDSYNLTEARKGDALWETSDSRHSSTSAWFGAYGQFSSYYSIFFRRGGGLSVDTGSNRSIFFYISLNGNDYSVEADERFIPPSACFLKEYISSFTQSNKNLPKHLKNS